MQTRVIENITTNADAFEFLVESTFSPRKVFAQRRSVKSRNLNRIVSLAAAKLKDALASAIVEDQSKKKKD